MLSPLVAEVRLLQGKLDSDIRSVRGKLSELQSEVNKTVSALSGGLAGRGAGGSSSGVEKTLKILGATNVVMREQNALGANLRETQEEIAVAAAKARAEIQKGTNEQVRQIESLTRSNQQNLNQVKERTKAEQDALRNTEKLRQDFFRNANADEVRAISNRDRSARDALRKSERAEREALRNTEKLRADEARAISRAEQDALRNTEKLRQDFFRNASADEARAIRNRDRSAAISVRKLEGDQGKVADLEKQAAFLTQARKEGKSAAEAMQAYRDHAEKASFATKELGDRAGKARETIRQMGGEAKTLGGQISSFILRFTAFTLAASILTRAFFSIQNALSEMVTSGFQFNGFLESSVANVATIFAGTRKIVDAQGEVVSSAKALPFIFEQAEKAQKRLFRDSLESKATFEEISGIYQQILVHVGNQVASEEDLLKLARAFADISVSAGERGQRAVVNARQFLEANRSVGNTIKDYLGLSLKQTQSLKEGGNLVQEALSRYKEIQPVLDRQAKTWDIIVSTANDLRKLVSADVFKGQFDALKTVLDAFGNRLVEIHDAGGLGGALGISDADLKQLGRDLADITISLASVLRDIIALGARITNIIGIRNVFAGLGVAIGGVALAIAGKLIPAIYASLKGIALFATATTLAAGPWVALLGAVLAVSAAAYAYIKVSDDVTKSLNDQGKAADRSAKSIIENMRAMELAKRLEGRSVASFIFDEPDPGLRFGGPKHDTEDAANTAAAEKAAREAESLAKRLENALSDIREKTAQAGTQFERTISEFAISSGNALTARLDEVALEIDEMATEIKNEFGDEKFQELRPDINKLSLARGRAAIAQSIKDEENLARRRISLAQEVQDTLSSIAQADVEINKISSQSRLESLQEELNLAERNAGIRGKANNSIQDRIRLMQEVAKEQVRLIELDIEEQQLSINTLQAKNDTLNVELARLEERRRDVIKFLKEVGGLDPRQEALINRGFDFGGDELRREVQRNEAEIKKTEANIVSLGNKATSVFRKTGEEAENLKKTLVNLNDPIANFFGNLSDVFLKGGNIFKNLKSVFKTLKDDITRSFSDAFRESIRKKLQFDFEFKGNIFELGEFFKNTFSNAASFVGDLFGGATGSGGFLSGLRNLFSGSGSSGGSGFLSNLFSGAGGGSSSGGGFFGNIFGGGGSFGGGSSGGGFLGGIFGGGGGATNIFGGSGGLTTFQPSSSISNLLGGAGGTGALTNAGAGFGGGAGAGSSLGAGIAGFQFAELFKSLAGTFGLDIGKSKQGQLGGNIGGTVGGLIGSIWGPVGAAIGAALGNILGSVIGDLFAPGRIEKEKKKIEKFFDEVFDGKNFKVLSEKKAAAGFEEFKGPIAAAAIALGADFATTAKKGNQGTIIRFAGQGLGNLKRFGEDTETAKESILELARAMDFDLKAGVSAIKANIGSGVLSLKEFKEEVKEARKNLKQYGDTSNLTANELSALATANGNTGSRLVTINEILAGTIDIAAEFDEFINGATIANNYLASSFEKTAKEGGLFNDQIADVAESIRSGKLSLEEAAIELNKFRKEAGLAAFDLGDFEISAKELDKQIQAIKDAVQTARDAIKSGILAGTTSPEFNRADIEKNLRRSIYSAMVDSVASGMVDGIIKGSLAAGPLSEAFTKIGDLTSKFVAGDLSDVDFFAGLETVFTDIQPAIDKLATAVGVTSERFRQMLADAGILPHLIDEATESAGELGGIIRDAAKESILDGLRGNKANADIEKSFRRAVYSTLVDTIVDGFIDGFIKATLATGPLEAAMKNIRGLIDKFVAGDINFDQFGASLGEEFNTITPLIERIAIAVGLTTEAFRKILDAAGILPDILDEATDNADDLAKELRQAAKDLLLDPNLSPLKPKQRVAEAQLNFEDLRRRALAGDKEAARLLPEAARQFLEEARKVFASSIAYEQIFDFVRGTLLEVADKFGPLEDIETAQLRTLEEIRAHLASADKSLKRISGEKPTDTDQDLNQGLGGDRERAPETRRRRRAGEDLDSFSGDRLYDALNNKNRAGEPAQSTDVAILLQDISRTLKQTLGGSNFGAGSDLRTTGSLESILSEARDLLRSIEYSAVSIHNKTFRMTSLLEQIVTNTGARTQSLSLADGGIVTRAETPAMLHGPEAVIPLPYGVGGGIHFTSPEIVEEIRSLRSEMRRTPREDYDQRPIVVQGDFNIGQEKLGEFVLKKVQNGLDRQQIRVPSKSIARG